MDEIQKTLIKAGRKDLAQKYFDRTSAKYIEREDLSYAMNEAFDALADSIKKVKNPDAWATKRYRSAPGVIEQMEKLTELFDKMR